MTVKTVAVTGASGQVGSALVRRLQAEGVRVVAVARNELGAALIHASTPSADIRVGSLTPEAGQRHLLDDCEVIVNCALASAGGNPRNAYSRNRALTDGMLQARSLRWLIHFSTVAVYGELITGRRTEAKRFERPLTGSEYGRSKLHIERYTAQRSRDRGLACTVLRLGHVYGAGIWRSREIIDLARDPKFSLPFDGRKRSNAIHADRMAGAVLALLAAAPCTAVWNLAEHANTWRTVFDWHTHSLGLSPVVGMSDEDSHEQVVAHAPSTVAREIGAWLGSLPIRQLARSPAVFDFALRVLASTPTTITRRVTNVNRRVEARRQIASLTRGGGDPVPVLYVSDGVPGPHLDLAPEPSSGLGSHAEMSRELYEWYRRWSTPPLAAAWEHGRLVARHARA
jgi:nucleoside-diphosphate-sugar epimerase